MARRRSSATMNSETSVAAMDRQKELLMTESGHFSMARALHMADYITAMNGFSGVTSIFFSLRYCADELNQDKFLYYAVVSMMMGLFFDFLDGRVARRRKKSSLLGQELDSLADLISFGVGPSALAFAIGFRSALDTIFLAYFVLCGLFRLARFNVTATYLPKDASGKAKYFEGTPIPTTLGLDWLMAYWIHAGWIQENLPLGVWAKGTWMEIHPVVFLFVVHGCLMVSKKTIHIPKP